MATMYKKLDAKPIIPFMEQKYKDLQRTNMVRKTSCNGKRGFARIDPAAMQWGLGISESSYFRIMRDGKVTVSTADEICCALGFHIDMFWDFGDN